jgi:ABC-type lipoprotein release transport system permease subunit
MPPQKCHLFQVNRHVQASIMLLSIMDGAELDLNNTLLSSSPKTTATTTTTTASSLSTSDDYEKGFSYQKNIYFFSLFNYL